MSELSKARIHQRFMVILSERTTFIEESEHRSTKISDGNQQIGFHRENAPSDQEQPIHSGAKSKVEKGEEISARKSLTGQNK